MHFNFQRCQLFNVTIIEAHMIEIILVVKPDNSSTAKFAFYAFAYDGADGEIFCARCVGLYPWVPS